MQLFRGIFPVQEYKHRRQQPEFQFSDGSEVKVVSLGGLILLRDIQADHGLPMHGGVFEVVSVHTLI